MKNIFTFLALFLCSSIALSKAGPELQEQKVSYIEAVELAQKKLPTTGCVIDGAKAYILSSLKYKRQCFECDNYWVVTLVHPKYNSNTVTFQITNDRKVKVNACTE